jgi:hypothetical protein
MLKKTFSICIAAGLALVAFSSFKASPASKTLVVNGVQNTLPAAAANDHVILNGSISDVNMTEMNFIIHHIIWKTKDDVASWIIETLIIPDDDQPTDPIVAASKMDAVNKLLAKY